MAQTFHATIHGKPYTVKTGAGRIGWPIRISVATTMGHSSAFEPGICPDVTSIGHENWHSENTNTLRYVWSFTVGRLYGSTYWKDQERAANQAGSVAHEDAELLAFAATIRAGVAASWPTATVTHPV